MVAGLATAVTQRLAPRRRPQPPRQAAAPAAPTVPKRNIGLVLVPLGSERVSERTRWVVSRGATKGAAKASSEDMMSHLKNLSPTPQQSSEVRKQCRAAYSRRVPWRLQGAVRTSADLVIPAVRTRHHPVHLACEAPSSPTWFMEAVPRRMSRPNEVNGLISHDESVHVHAYSAGLEVPGRLPCMAVVISRPAELLVGRFVPGRAKPVSGRPVALTGRTTWLGPPPAS